MKGFFYAGVMMRGWSGQGPYPLKSIETSDRSTIKSEAMARTSSLQLCRHSKPFLPEPDPILLAPLEEDAFEQLLRTGWMRRCLLKVNLEFR